MKTALGWLLLGSPLLVCVVCCAALISQWKDTERRVAKAIAIAASTGLSLYAFGRILYVHMKGPMPAFDYRLEIYGFLLSLLSVTVGLFGLPPLKWYSVLSFVMSAYLLVLFFLMGLTF